MIRRTSKTKRRAWTFAILAPFRGLAYKLYDFLRAVVIWLAKRTIQTVRKSG